MGNFGAIALNDDLNRDASRDPPIRETSVWLASLASSGYVDSYNSILALYVTLLNGLFED